MKKVDREIYTATTSASGISLDLILNTLSGRLKKLKFKRSIVNEDENVNLVFEKYKYLFEQSFNIKKKMLLSSYISLFQIHFTMKNY